VRDLQPDVSHQGPNQAGESLKHRFCLGIRWQVPWSVSHTEAEWEASARVSSGRGR
jgi:hypothetical protein